MNDWLSRVFGRRSAFEADMADELRTHIELRARDLVGQGVDPAEARRRARLEFGSIEGYKDRCRSERRLSGVSTAVEHVWRDVRFGWRRLRRAPLFATFAVLTLAIGIGATTAIYSVIHATLLRPLDIRDIDEVVNIYRRPLPTTAIHLMTFSWPEVAEIRTSQTVFSDVLAWSFFLQQMTGPNGTEIVRGEIASGNYFSFVGAVPMLGRALQPVDDDPASPDVIVISEALWHRQFAGDASAIGRTLTLRGHPYEVVGVMPASFRGVDLPNVIPTNVWAPIRSAAVLRGPLRLVGGSAQDVWTSDNWVFLKGRLRRERSLNDARVEMAAIGARLAASAPSRMARSDQAAQGFHVTMASDLHAHESVDFIAVPIATAVLVAMGLALLVACTNLANFMLARGERRRRDMAVVRALGATRTRMVRELAAESAIVAVAGCAAGLLFSAWLMHLLSGRIAAGRGISIALAPRFEPAVVAVTIAATVGAMLVFGLLPAWRASRVDMRALIAASSGGVLPRWRGRRILIALQVAISVALLVISAQFARAAVASAWIDRGVEFDGMAVAEMDFVFKPYDRAGLMAIVDRASDALSRIPGVEAVAVTNSIPGYLGSAATSVVDTVPHAPPEPGDYAAMLRLPRTTLLEGTQGQFEALGVHIRQGRAFTADEVAANAPVCIVSEPLAARLFGMEPATGRTIFLMQDPCTIVGVTRDIRSPNMRSPYEVGVLHRPLAPDPNRHRALTFVVRTAADPAVLRDDIRLALRGIDADLPLTEVTTGDDILASGTLFTRVSAQITVLLGFFTLLLALVGLSGLLAYVVANRRREMGLRMALGAEPSRIRWMVIHDGLWAVLPGVAVGVLAGVLAGQLPPLRIAGMIAGQRTFDWLTVSGVVAVLLVAAFVACDLPARIAARVNPNEALKEL